MKLNGFKGIGTKFSEARQALKAKLPGKHRHHKVSPSEGEPQEALRGNGQSTECPDLDQRHIVKTQTEPLLTSASEETAQTAPDRPKADLQSQPEATPVINESTKARLLAKVVKKLIGLKTDALDNKEEIQALRKRKQEIKSASKRADKELSNAEDRLKSLQKDLSSRKTKNEKATKAKKKDPVKIASLEAEIRQLETALQQQTTAVAKLKKNAQTLQQQLDEATEAKQEAQDNGLGLVNFGVGFATSLRKLHKLQNDQSQEATQARNKKVSFTHPRIVIETDSGKVEIKDLQMTLKAIRFETNRLGRPIPVFGVDELKGKVLKHIPGGECLKINLDLKDVEITIDTGLGKALHSYVTTSNSVEALGRLLSGGIEALGVMKPRLISVTGNQAGVHLEDCRAASITALIKHLRSTPDTTAEIIFKTLGFNITGQLEQFNLDVTGDIGVSASAHKVSVDYQPVAQGKKAKGVTRRNVKASIGDGAVTAKHGLSMMQEVMSAVSSSKEKLAPDSKDSPLSALTSLPREASAEAYASAKNLELEFNRELSQQQSKKKDSCRCHDIVKIEASKLTARNTGSLGLTASVHGLNASTDTVHSDFGPETATRESHGVELDMSSAVATVDAPEGLLPEEVMEQQLTVTGQAKVSTGKTHVSLKSSKEQQHLTARSPDLKASVSMPVSVRLGENGVHLPKGMELKASGAVDVDSTGSVVQITPALTVKSNDKLYAELGGARLPVDLKAKVTLDKVDPRLFMNKDPHSKTSTVTSVMSSGSLKLDAPRLGPVHIDDMSLNLTDADNGIFEANGIEVDFDALSAGDSQAGAEGLKLSWLPRALLKHKKLTLSVNSPVKNGVLKLDVIRSVTPQFVSTENAGTFDRMATWFLNRVSGVILPKVQQFTVSFGEVGGDGLPSESSPPILNLKVGPIRKRIPLTGLDGAIGTDGNSIPVAELLRQNTGMVLARKKDVDKVEQSLREIREGKESGLSSLVDMVLMAKGRPEQSGLVHLIARQFPTNDCRKILAQKKSTLHQRLAECETVFRSVPGLTSEARRLQTIITGN